MSVATGALVYEEPGKVPSAVLAVLVHLLLAVFLFFGVHWQSRQPEASWSSCGTACPHRRCSRSSPGRRSARARPEPRLEPKPETRLEPKSRK